MDASYPDSDPDATDTGGPAAAAAGAEVPDDPDGTNVSEETPDPDPDADAAVEVSDAAIDDVTEDSAGADADRDGVAGADCELLDEALNKLTLDGTILYGFSFINDLKTFSI